MLNGNIVDFIGGLKGVDEGELREIAVIKTIADIIDLFEPEVKDVFALRIIGKIMEDNLAGGISVAVEGLLESNFHYLKREKEKEEKEDK